MENIVNDLNNLIKDFSEFKTKQEQLGEVVTKSALDEFATKMNSKLEAIQKEKEAANVKNDIFGTAAKAEKFYDFLASGPAQSNINLKNVVRVNKDAPLNATTNADGKYLVPQEYSNDLQRLITQAGIARRLHQVINLTEGNSLDFPVRENDDDAGFITAEGSAMSDNDLVFKSVIISPKEIGVMISSSNKLMRQSRISVAEIVATALAEKAGRFEDKVVFNANGSNDAANGQQYGYFGNTSIKGITRTVGDFELSDLGALLNSVPDEVYENDASAFYMSRSTYQLLLSAKVDNKKNHYGMGQPATIVLDANGRPTIYGKPIMLISALTGYKADDSESGDNSSDGKILYGNLYRAGRIVTIGNFAIEASSHALFKNNSTMWRLNYDFGFGVVNTNAVAKLTITA